ncbi:PucR family transcriptional regulator [Sporichthya brevicatena]|uniref:PucR family transcriptional regulator n=1 Tax=Sporichthya brevicatena TaxID=171442 RepID=A0ABN1GEW0_9ACTN
MLDATPRSLTAVADALMEREEALVTAQVKAVREFAGYDRIPLPSLRSSARRNVLRVVSVLRGSPDLPAEAEETERQSGGQRALQGIPADVVVGAYRAVMGLLREEFLATATDLQIPAVDVLHATRLLWDLTDRYSTEVVAERQQIDIEFARRDEQERLAFLQRLLTGTLLPAEVLVGGVAYGLVPDAEYWVSRGRHPEEHRHALSRRLEYSGATSTFRPLIGWIDGDVVAVTAKRPTVEADGAVLAVSGPVPPAGFPQAFGEATRLLNVAARFQRQGLVDNNTLSIRIAVVEEGELSEALLARYATPVLATGATAGIVLSTVRTFLACRRHIAETAAALSVHVNTVRYRLARYAELTGADLDDTETLIEVWWALESWALREQTPGA